ncbi:MAG: chemotaxis protein CheX [Magnetococcus sp. DMHC-6]
MQIHNPHTLQDHFLTAILESVQAVSECFLAGQVTPMNKTFSDDDAHRLSLHQKTVASIQFSGKIQGGVYISSSSHTTALLAQAFLEEEHHSDTKAQDAFGELANIIAGGVQCRCEKIVGKIDISTPMITIGMNHVTRKEMSPIKKIRQYFSIQEHNFLIEAYLSPSTHSGSSSF